MPLAAPNQNDIAKQTRRAVDLLDFVLGIFNERAVSNNDLVEIADQIGRARVQLLTVIDPSDRGYSETIASCCGLLNDALRIASRAHELPLRQANRCTPSSRHSRCLCQLQIVLEQM